MTDMRSRLAIIIAAVLFVSGVSGGVASAQAQPAQDDATSTPTLRGFLRDRDGDVVALTPPREDP
jgi:hypothetical protein